MHSKQAGQISISVSAAAVICLALIAGFVVVDLLVFAKGASFKREGGGLETVSAVLYGVAVVLFFLQSPPGVWSRLWHVPALLALFAMRELDFDKAFTQSGVLSLKMYTGDASLSAKLVAGFFALLAVLVLLRCVFKGFPSVWRGLLGGQAWALYTVVAAGLIVFTKSIDGLGRKLADWGIIIAAETDAMAALVEEVGEAFIPVFAILAIAARWKGKPE